MKIFCAIHGKELTLDGEPMIFCGQSVWKCPEQGCHIRVGISEMD